MLHLNTAVILQHSMLELRVACEKEVAQISFSVCNYQHIKMVAKRAQCLSSSTKPPPQVQPSLGRIKIQSNLDLILIRLLALKCVIL